MTQGRVAPTGDEFDLVAFVVATGGDAAPGARLQPEHHAILSAAWEAISVVELASTLDLSLGVIRVLLGDLRSVGLISLYEPPAATQPHDVDVLKAVVNGLRAL
jgi:hypothetical protein